MGAPGRFVLNDNGGDSNDIDERRKPETSLRLRRVAVPRNRVETRAVFVILIFCLSLYDFEV
jgi:hypothetical protein